MTEKMLADDVAVRALLSRDAGPSFRPNAQPGGREKGAPAVLRLQQLSPPSAFKPNLLNRTMKTLWASPDLKPARNTVKSRFLW